MPMTAWPPSPPLPVATEGLPRAQPTLHSRSTTRTTTRPPAMTANAVAEALDTGNPTMIAFALFAQGGALADNDAGCAAPALDDARQRRGCRQPIRRRRRPQRSSRSPGPPRPAGAGANAIPRRRRALAVHRKSGTHGDDIAQPRDPALANRTRRSRRRARRDSGERRADEVVRQGGSVPKPRSPRHASRPGRRATPAAGQPANPGHSSRPPRTQPGYSSHTWTPGTAQPWGRRVRRRIGMVPGQASRSEAARRHPLRHGAAGSHPARSGVPGACAGWVPLPAGSLH
jgi:hypothetical protein